MRLKGPRLAPAAHDTGTFSSADRLVALARFGGLRIPSEALSLKWEHIDGEQERITVPSPKIEHHVGKAKRVIPLFPEWKSYLEDAWDQAEAGAVHVIAKHRRLVGKSQTSWKAVNLRTPLLKIIRRAGLTAWPKLWQNMRSTRETELAEDFLRPVVYRWIGNSRQVAMEHSLQVTDEHFKRGASKDSGSTVSGGAESGAAARRSVSQDFASSIAR